MGVEHFEQLHREKIEKGKKRREQLEEEIAEAEERLKTLKRDTSVLTSRAEFMEMVAFKFNRELMNLVMHYNPEDKEMTEVVNKIGTNVIDEMNRIDVGNLPEGKSDLK